MSHGDNDDDLRNLEERLEKARREARRPASPAPAGPDGRQSRSALALALRIGLDLVVGVFGGAFLGWAFDNWLGTRPWGLIVFLFLGFAAGVTNVFRLALGTQRAVGYAPPKAGAQKPVVWSDDDED